MKQSVQLFWLIGLSFLQAFILTFYWEWFIVPMFTIQPITLLQALSLCFLLALLDTSKANTKKEVTVEYISNVLLYLLVAWGFGWILSLLV